MANPIQCVHCKRVGLVRVEHIVKAELTFLSYYCGACNHIWLVAENDEQPAKRRGEPADRPEPSES